MKFPVDSRICYELLSDYYQRLEDIQKLISEDFRQKEYFITSNIDRTWLSGRILYNEENQLKKEQVFSRLGKLIDCHTYSFSTGKVVAKANEERSTWFFNDDKILIEEIHEYDYDEPDFYKFNFDNDNRLVNINEEIQLVWDEEKPIELIDLRNSKIWKKVLQKSNSESLILNLENNKTTLFKYDNHERLIRIELGEQSTLIDYFEDDRIKCSEVKTVFNNKITYKSYSEERMIDDKIIESITKFYDDGVNLNRIVKEIKTLK